MRMRINRLNTCTVSLKYSPSCLRRNKNRYVTPKGHSPAIPKPRNAPGISRTVQKIRPSPIPRHLQYRGWVPFVQSTHIYTQSTTVYVPLTELGPSTPLFRRRLVSPPPGSTSGGIHSPVGDGVGGPTTGKKHSTLSTLWGTVRKEISSLYG